MTQGKRRFLIAVYVVATIQLAWCYLWLTRPYVNTFLYERGKERMPFQGRLMMMLPMRLAHSNLLLHWLALPFGLSHFWFPRPVQPEVLIQAVINVACLLATGWFTTRIYQASSRRRLLAPFVYPLVLVVCGATYVMHTVQNFRFIYDMPSLAFFSLALYLVYFRRHWSLFVLTFLVATVNRETTLLLLPLYMIDAAVVNGKPQWKRLADRRTLAVVLPLAACWIVWQMTIRHIFAQNPSEFYPRLNWNVKSLLVPQAWPQLLSACGYLLLFVVVMRRQIPDPRLRAWLWLVPLWIAFMFSFGILIETRVFGELIPLVVCASTLIVEDMLLGRFAESTPIHRQESLRYQQRLSGAMRDGRERIHPAVALTIEEEVGSSFETNESPFEVALASARSAVVSERE